MRLRLLHEPHALVYVHGRSGPADQSNENLAAKEGHFVQLSGSSQDLRDFDRQSALHLEASRALRPRQESNEDGIGKERLQNSGLGKYEPLTGQPLEVV